MTRDPERIERILEKVEERWKDAPDLRLAQIIGNAGQSLNYGTDPYYMEDWELEMYLDSKLDQ